MKEIKKKKKVGRKWFDLTEEDISKGRTEEFIVSKLREVWSIDGTNAEASSIVNISENSISRYLKANPEEAELRQRLKEKPTLKARNIVMQKMGDSYGNAMDYLKRKRSVEFGDKQQIDLNEITVDEKKKKTVGEAINKFLNK